MKGNGISSLFVILIIVSSIFINGCMQKDIQETTDNIILQSKGIVANLEDTITNETKRKEIKINTASQICGVVIDNNLQQIDVTNIQTYEDYTMMVDNFNLIIKILNDKMESDFKVLNKELASYDKFMMEIKRYSPLVDNYNEVIDSCYNFNDEDDESINNFYTHGITFAAEATLVVGGAFYGVAFATTGALARTFGLTKMASICGPCVSSAMSTIHWYIRDRLTEATSGLVEKVIS